MLTSTRPHEDIAAQDSNEVFQPTHIVSCTSPQHQKAFTSSVEHAFVSAPTFLLQRSELLTGTSDLFFWFSPYSFYSLFHIQLLDDTWNRTQGAIKN